MSGLVEILPPESTAFAVLDPAEEARETVDRLLDDIRDHEFGLAANYARLGAVLFDIRRHQWWERWDYLSFGSYINDLHERVQKGRSQLYACISIAEKLLPELAESTLVAMGITKAGELRRFVAQSGRRIPEPLLSLAVDDKTTAKELRAAVFQELHQEPDPQGKWHDFGGAYLLADERKEIDEAFRIATLIDPVIPHDMPDHVRKKEVMLRFAREFVSTYAEPVARGEA